MSDGRFDAAAFYTFDLTTGTVRIRQDASRAAGRALLLPDSVLVALAQASLRSGDFEPWRQLGVYLGQQAARSLGRAAKQLGLEEVLVHAGGTLGVFGWGRLGVEQWGGALALTLDHAPDIDPHQEVPAALLGGLITALVERPAACVAVDKKRFLVVDPQLAEPLWQWSKRGVGLVSIVERLEAA